jgi:hypothetical protein
LTVSDDRAISAFAASHSTSRPPALIPGRDSANAANAPSFDTCRIRTTVVDPGLGRSHGDLAPEYLDVDLAPLHRRQERLRPPPSPVFDRPSSSMARSSSLGQRPHEMICHLQ